MTRLDRFLPLLTALAIGSAASGCASSSSSDDIESFDELRTPAASERTTMRGRLLPGEHTPLAIKQSVGREDHLVIDLDLSKTRIAGDEATLNERASDQDLLVRGKIERRDTGEEVHGSHIMTDVLVADLIGREKQNRKQITGTLRKDDGRYVVRVTVGSGNDTDDTGSLEVDFSDIEVDAQALVGKRVRVQGALVEAFEGAAGSSLIVRERILARSVARRR